MSGVYQPKKELKDSTIPIALSTFLKANPQIKTLYLHLDNDNTGRRCTAALKVLLQKDYEIVDAPPPVGKDVNDFQKDTKNNIKFKKESEELSNEKICSYSYRTL